MHKVRNFHYKKALAIGNIMPMNFWMKKDVLECADDLDNVRYGTCPINLTVAIDFSSAMINPENIEYVISRSNL